MALVTQEKRLITFTSPLGPDVFAVTDFQGQEEMSRLFQFTLNLASENTAVTAVELVGKAVSWKVNLPAETPRQFHGFVNRFTAGPLLSRGVRSYQIEVVPWLWFLTQTMDCRIFQNKTAMDIVLDVFGAYGFSAYENSITATLTSREYCVQYRESAFNFVSRLLEEEGIYYFFKFAEGAHTLVMADTPSAYYDCDPHASVGYRPNAIANAIPEWRRLFEFHPGEWAHTDYNFTTPSTALLSTEPTTKTLTDMSKFKLFDYPGRYGTSSAGKTLGAIRIEEIEVRYENAEGTSNCSSFAPAAKFSLTDHPSDDDSYVLLAVQHSATEGQLAGMQSGQATYSNRFRCMPATVKYRPARITPRPSIHGPQPAVVVGPSGEEIYTDQYGRIKVQFFWDRVGTNNENSSCWMRVSEMWAGKNWGMIFTPRIGQEVLVDFLEGDPDFPIVTGRVYNANQMPPYALPDNMTQSGIKTRSTKTGGTEDFNELRFEDKKGNELIYFHAQKDFQRHVEHDDKLDVLGNQTITITGDRTELVDKGNETITIKTGNRVEEVTAGNETVTVKAGKRTLTVKMDDTHVIQDGNRAVTLDKGDDTLTVTTGKRTQTIKGDDTLTVQSGNRQATISSGNEELTVSSGTITIKASASTITIEAGQSITLKAGSAEIVIGPTNIEMKGVNITMAADAQASLKGNAQAELNSSGMAVVKGSLVQIN